MVDVRMCVLGARVAHGPCLHEDCLRVSIFGLSSTRACVELGCRGKYARTRARCACARNLVALQIRQSASQGLEFVDLGTTEVKGKTELIKMYRPMPPDVEYPTSMPPGSEPNLPKVAYDKQVTNLFNFRLLRPYQVRPPPAKDKTAFSIPVTEAAPSTGAGAPAAPTPGLSLLSVSCQ